MNKLDHEVLDNYFELLSQRAENTIQELQLLQKQLKEIKHQLKVKDEAPRLKPQLPEAIKENITPVRNNNPNDLIRIKEVIAMTGVSRSFIYHQRKTGDFPSPVNLGARSVAWVRSTVEDWIKSKIAKS